MEGETTNTLSLAVQSRWGMRTPSPPPRTCIEPITPIHTPSIPYGELAGSESPKRRRLNKTSVDGPTPQHPPANRNAVPAFHAYSEMNLYSNYALSGIVQPQITQPTTFSSNLDLLATLAIARDQRTSPPRAEVHSKPPAPLEGPANIHSYPHAERRSFALNSTIIPNPSDGAAFSPLSLAKDKLISSVHTGYGSSRVSQHPAYPSTILTMPSNPITFVPTSISQPPSKAPSKSRSRAKLENKTNDRRRSNRNGHTPGEGSESPRKHELLEPPALVERTMSDIVVDVLRDSGPAEGAALPVQDIAPKPATEEIDPEYNGDVPSRLDSVEAKIVDTLLPAIESPSASLAAIETLPVQATPVTNHAQPAILQPIAAPSADESTSAKPEQALPFVTEPSPQNTIPTPPSSELPLKALAVSEGKDLLENNVAGQVSPTLSDSTVVLGEEPISPPRDVVMTDAEPIATLVAPALSVDEATVEAAGFRIPTPAVLQSSNTNEVIPLVVPEVVDPEAAPIPQESLLAEEAKVIAQLTSSPPKQLVPNGHYSEQMDVDEPTTQTTDTEICAICKLNSANDSSSSNTVWIECDACKQWHHNSCAGLDDKDVELIDKFHCPTCEKTVGPSTLRRKSTRMRASIDYGALNEGSTIPIRSEENHHHYVPLLEDNRFEFEGDHLFERVAPEDLVQKTYDNPDGWRFPLVITAESNPRPDGSALSNYPSTMTSSEDGTKLEAPLPTIATDAIGMAIPSDLTVRKVADLIGHDYPINVIDVRSQNQEKNWHLGRWADYYESPKKDVVRNVISLEVSQTRLGSLIQRPKVVQQMDLSDWAWPTDVQKPTSVKLYCLMSVKKSFTDFHIDFGGSSVFYHVISGQKTFLFIEPTEENLKAYEEWCNHPDQNYEWLAKGRTCYRVDLSAGDTMLIPSGWIHAVYTPADSLVIGGNFLTRQNIVMQMRVHEIETRTKVPRQFRYPNFAKLHWFVAQKYVLEDPVPLKDATDIMLGSPAHKRVDYEPLPGRVRLHLPELSGLVNLCNFLARNSLIASGDIEVAKETRSAVGKSIPKTLPHHGYDFVKDFAIWVCWKRSAGEKIPKWALPGAPRGHGFQGVAPTDKLLVDKERTRNEIGSTRARFETYLAANTILDEAKADNTHSESVAPRTPAPVQAQLAVTPSSAKSRSKRKRESKIDEDVFKEAISRVSMAGTFTRPKLTILGPLKTACDNCSKKKVRCVHKEEVQAKQREVQEVYNRLLREKHAAAGLAPEEYEVPTPIAKRRASGAKSVRPDVQGTVPGIVEDSVIMEDNSESGELLRPAQETLTEAPLPSDPVEPMEYSMDLATSNSNAVEANSSIHPREQDEKGIFGPTGIVAKNGRKKACNACRAVRRRCLHAPDGSGLVVDEASLQRAGVNTQPVVRKSRQEAASAIKASSAPPPSTRSTERSPEAVPLVDGTDGRVPTPLAEEPARMEQPDAILASDSDVVAVPPAAIATEDIKEEANETKIGSIPTKQELAAAVPEPTLPPTGPDDDDNDSVCSKLTSVMSSELSEPENDDHLDDHPSLLVTLRFPSKKTRTSLTSSPPPAPGPQAAIPNPSPARLSPPRRLSKPKVSPPMPQRLTIAAPSPIKRKHASSTSPTTKTGKASSPPAHGKRPRRSSSSRVEDTVYHPHHQSSATPTSAAAALEGTDLFEESKVHEFGLRRRRSAGR